MTASTCAFQSGPAPCATTIVPTRPSPCAPPFDAAAGEAGRWATTDAGVTVNRAAMTAALRDPRLMLCPFPTVYVRRCLLGHSESVRDHACQGRIRHARSEERRVGEG